MANILIADDDKDIIRMLRFYLEKEGLQIYEAYDGNMAFMVLQNYGIDVALVDIMMPHMDGFDLIQKVRRTMDVPILVISAKVDLSDRIRGLDLGADDYYGGYQEGNEKDSFRHSGWFFCQGVPS